MKLGSGYPTIETLAAVIAHSQIVVAQPHSPMPALPAGFEDLDSHAVRIGHVGPIGHIGGHPGFRANLAKRLVVAAFKPSSEAAGLSRAELFSGGPIPATVRSVKATSV